MVAIVHSFSAREPQVQTYPWGGSIAIWYEVIDQHTGIMTEKYSLSHKPEHQIIQLGWNFSSTSYVDEAHGGSSTRLVVRHCSGAQREVSSKGACPLCHEDS
jgi:hypothetical protein